MYTIVRKQLASQTQDAFCFVKFSHVKKMRYKLIWVFPKIGVSPKMDGENNGKPY